MIKVKALGNMPEVYSVEEIPNVEYVTKNLYPGITVYGEQLFLDENEVEYRQWAHNKSKLASGLLNGLRLPNLTKGAHVLYLGAANGTTVSHVSDIVGEEGLIFAVEFSSRTMRDLYNLARIRKNIIPILADARYPEEYSDIVHAVDLVYCDVAQPNQSEILIKNSKAFLKADGMAFIAMKTRSISQKGRAKDIFDKEVKKIEENGFKTQKIVNISKIHREHYIYTGKLKS